MSEAVYKILTADQWAAMQAAGRFEGSADDLRDGFIHLSAKEQVAGTLARHFAGQEGLMLLEIDPSLLGDALKWEPSRGGALFPHLYAPLGIGAVVETRPA